MEWTQTFEHHCTYVQGVSKKFTVGKFAKVKRAH